MLNRFVLASTLALATASFTTGCDKGGALVATISNKAHELEGKLTAFVGDKLQGLKTRLDGASQPLQPTRDDAPELVIPDGAFDADRGWQVEAQGDEAFEAFE